MAISAARQAQLSQVPVKEVQALVHVRSSWPPRATALLPQNNKTGNLFEELIQDSNKSAAKTFFERGTNTSSKLTGCLISAADEAHAQLLILTAPKAIKI